MEGKNDNILNNEEVREPSSKMQDILGIPNLGKINDKNNTIEIQQINQEDEIREFELINENKTNLYRSIYLPIENKKKENKEQTKPKVTLQRKNNLLNFKKNNINDELSYLENVKIYIDDNNNRESEIIIQNYECRFLFDEEIHMEFINLVHFTPKYFEFPIYYVSEGSFNESTNTTIITLKDFRSFKIKSSGNQIYNKLFNNSINNNDFYKYALLYKDEQTRKNIKYEIDGWKIYDPICEYLRQGVEFSDTKFCFSYKNNKYEVCDTYPYILVIPKKFDNDELLKIAKSRTKNRIPILSYYYHNEKNVHSYMFRSAQINKGGVIFKNKNLEIEYVNTLTNMDNNNNGFIIFDCRPEINAKANALKGAGIENKKDYNNCNGIIFGCIENIHAVRKSLEAALLKSYYGKEKLAEGKVSFDIKNSNMTNFLSDFEKTKWLEYLSDLLLSSISVSKFLLRNINVLVHCSDGWDRTAQVCSLVQIILDPFFRTIEGFAVLIEKEWISFGHQFAIRNGCDVRKDKKDEKSPIFIQFLHAVYQMTMQYPTAFEFNNNLLLFLSEQIYSNKYGTFLFNCEKEKFMNKAHERMVSIWSDIFLEKNKYINDLYKPINTSINIKGELKYLSIWNDFFFKYDKVGMAWDDAAILDKEGYVSKIVEEKTKSILELLQIIKDCGQEERMKENKIYKLYKNTLDKTK